RPTSGTGGLLAVGARARDRVFGDGQCQIAVSDDNRNLHRDSRLAGDESGHHLTDRRVPADELAWLGHERRSWFVEINRGLDIAGVDVLGDQVVAIFRLVRSHGVPSPA